EALVKFARAQGGDLIKNVVAVDSAPIDIQLCPCDEGGCAVLDAGSAKIKTRCLNDKHDKICGNESAFYPPLVKGVKVTPAMAAEHPYSGKGVDETWQDADRRGAYIGSFAVR